jgi:hypothetical protein
MRVVIKRHINCNESKKLEQIEIVKEEICLFMKLIFLTTKFFLIIKALPPKGLPLTGEIIISDL